MKDVLDDYEKDIEINFEKQESIGTDNIRNLFKNAAKTHTMSKRSITLRVSEQDIEAIKIKASKCGLPYQTYINMLIHTDVSKL